MLSQIENSAHRDLSPAEVIRQVKERFRVCRYLFAVAAIWVVAGALLYFLWLGFDYSSPHFRLVSFVVQFVGYAALSIAFVVQVAIYRCPVCDTYLGRKLKDKLHCPTCNARVKAQ
jgi:hypothetical protein